MSYKLIIDRVPDKEHIFISIMPISSPNSLFGHLLESCHRDDSNKWSNIGFDEEITQEVSGEFNFIHLIWSSDKCILYEYMMFFAGVSCIFIVPYLCIRMQFMVVSFDNGFCVLLRNSRL